MSSKSVLLHEFQHFWEFVLLVWHLWYTFWKQNNEFVILNITISNIQFVLVEILKYSAYIPTKSNSHDEPHFAPHTWWHNQCAESFFIACVLWYFKVTSVVMRPIRCARCQQNTNCPFNLVALYLQALPIRQDILFAYTRSGMHEHTNKRTPVMYALLCTLLASLIQTSMPTQWLGFSLIVFPVVYRPNYEQFIEDDGVNDTHKQTHGHVELNERWLQRVVILLV